MTAPHETIGTQTLDVSNRDHAIFWTSALIIVGFAVWASVSTLDIVSVAEGEVIPSSHVKSVQHLEGGIVREINVLEGQEIEEGDTLVILEPTVSGADVAELRVRMTGLAVEIAQLEAMAENLDIPAFPKEIASAHPDLVQQAKRRFETRRARHLDVIAAQEKTVQESKRAIEEVESRIAGNRKSLRLVTEQVGMSSELLGKGLVNRFKHLDLLKEQGRARNAVATDTATLAKAQAARAAAQAELVSIRSKFADDTQIALEQARLKSREFSQRVKKFEDSLDRTVVRSPVDGIVKTLNVTTVGGVIRPGDTIADIVPVEDALIVEAKLATQDIGYVAIGQQAAVKLASSDAIRYGNLQGNVVSVSPDTLVSDDGRPYYRVRIGLLDHVFVNGALRYELFPGMQVLASIQTGERTVLEYILDPLRSGMDEAFKER